MLIVMLSLRHTAVDSLFVDFFSLSLDDAFPKSFKIPSFCGTCMEY